MVAIVILCICIPLLSPDKDFSFGRRQVNQMVDDRPEMGGIFDEDAEIVEWLVKRFEGDSVESRIYWNAEEPLSGFSAEHSRRYHIYPAQIRVDSGKTLSGLDKWVAVVFEVHNLDNSKSFEGLEQAAASGGISEKEFVKKCIALELDAVDKTEIFLSKTLEAAQLKMSGQYRGYLAAAQRTRAGIKYDTGAKHREYYQMNFRRIQSWATSNP